jgi:Rieske 2Fe-2S family protein
MPPQASVRPARLTLPASFYTDPGHFRREIERFFFDRWICAGRGEEIAQPGDYLLRDILGESIVVVRDEAGDVRAFYNVCRHRGTRLCESPRGTLRGAIQCPYHAWTYDLRGRLIGAPHMDGVEGFRREDHPLKACAADTWDGHVFIHAGGLQAAERAPLASQIGALRDRFRPWRMEELRAAHRTTYDVRANWKLIVQNYNECLHCPVLHPLLNRMHHYLGADNAPSEPDYCGGTMGFKEGVETLSVDGRLRRRHLPGLDEAGRALVSYFAIYPNLLLTLHPDYMVTVTLWPRAPDRTELVCEWHFHPDEIARPDFVCQDAIDFWEVTNREDWHVSELAQAGISSRAYEPGPYSNRERLLCDFDQVVLRALGED